MGHDDSKNRKLSFLTFFIGWAANFVGIATGVAMPITTEPGVLSTSSGYEWPERVWTASTRMVMWWGLGTMFTLMAIALAIGFYARHMRRQPVLSTRRPQEPHSLVLSPAKDLGIVMALLAPVAMFVAESVSMFFVQRGS